MEGEVEEWAMKSPHRGWQLDAAHSSDEILLLLARAGSLIARDELLMRAQELMTRCFGILARRFGLTWEDREDLQQQLVFWTLEAVGAYDAEELAKRDGCSFRTFLRRVVARRVANFFQAKQRRGNHFVDPQRLVKMGGGTLDRQVGCLID